MEIGSDSQPSVHFKRNSLYSSNTEVIHDLTYHVFQTELELAFSTEL